jgi:hypothetical protein
MMYAGWWLLFLTCNTCGMSRPVTALAGIAWWNEKEGTKKETVS